MRARAHSFLACLGAVLLMAATTASAGALKLADPFGDAMVLQRDLAVPVWGQAEPGATVAVDFAGQRKTIRADATGAWLLRLAPLAASSSNRVMTVASGPDTLVVKDVLVGEVWLCSGQSNMEMGVPMAANANEEIAAANHPTLRLRFTSQTTAPVPQCNLNGSGWMICSPATIRQGTWGGFSATAYYFGRQLLADLKVPVGVIQTSWGGTLIEPWTPVEGFRLVPKLTNLANAVEKANADYQAAATQFLDRITEWEKTARAALASHTFVPQPPPAFAHAIRDQMSPTALFNSKISPWIPYAIRGAIWYQGESNLLDGPLYTDKMKALIGGWRQLWGQGDFPFYFVQIAPYHYGSGRSCEALPVLWEAQTAALKIPNTGMAIINDVGEVADIHPHNKQEVGRRLALLALSRSYGVKVVDDSGPLFKGSTVQGDAIKVEFDHANSGLAARDGKALNEFEIAGEDGVFVPAEAAIQDRAVLVRSTNVLAPRYVRFAWRDEACPNLMNGEKLPASAFRVIPHNLASRAPYTCSNPNTHGFGLAGLTDGSWAFNNAINCFASNEDDRFPKEVTVDLQEVKTVARLRFGVPGYGSTKTVAASISEDGKTFVEVGLKLFSQDKAEAVDFTFTPARARYIKLTYPDRYDRQVTYPIGFVFTTELEAY